MYKTVEDVDVHLAVWHCLHLLVKKPCIVHIHINVLVVHLRHHARSCIHSDQLVEDILVHDSAFKLQLLQDVERSLYVADHRTCLQNSDVSDVVRLDVLHVHEVPVLDCLRRVFFPRCTSHHDRVEGF